MYPRVYFALRNSVGYLGRDDILGEREGEPNTRRAPLYVLFTGRN